MNIQFHLKRFARQEDGSLLVFFLVSIATVLGIVALSFDMGRRASTQTDMQSFVDNVALAAAGELDGSANSTTNATNAANTVIAAANEMLKPGTTGNPAADNTITIAQIVFYEQLPARDTPSSFVVSDLETSKYTLPASDLADPFGADAPLAKFVGVRLTNESVDWLFADMLPTAGAPGTAVGAVAVAGISGWTCEISPLMFCLPRDASGNVEDLTPGVAVQLQTVGNGAAWNPGEFGYLDISSIPDAVAGPCASETPESRKQACLLAQGISACFEDRGVDIQTGQRAGQEPAGFNLPFGIFGQAMNNLRGDPIYDVGPHIISGQVTDNGCRSTGDSLDTMAFPSDDCHPNCLDASGNPTRFGDGNWSAGLTTYLDTNYAFTPPATTAFPAPTPVPGSFFDFVPVDPIATPPPQTRYEYYLLEAERASLGGVMPDYVNGAASGDGGRGGVLEDVAGYTTWDDYWPDTIPANPGFNPIIPDAQLRSEDGLPTCTQVDPTTNTDRRLVVVAGIDCPPFGEEGYLTGDEDDVPVEQYYEVFLIAPARESGGTSGSPLFELFVEVVQPLGSEGGASTTTASAFREVVQLYR